jgi:hypothetical protein
MQSYTHKELGTEIRSISGYLTYLEENRLSFRGGDVLYTVGIGIIDNSCCGAGGCQFIEVSGYIISWKAAVSRDGKVISLFNPIGSEEEKKDIQAELDILYPHSQVIFSL